MRWRIIIYENTPIMGKTTKTKTSRTLIIYLKERKITIIPIEPRIYFVIETVGILRDTIE